MFTSDPQEYQDAHCDLHNTASLHSHSWLQDKLAVDFLNRLGFVYAVGTDLNGVEHRFTPGTYSPVTINSAHVSLSIDTPPHAASIVSMFSVYIGYTYGKLKNQQKVAVTCFDAISNTVSVTLLPNTNPTLSIILHASEAENFSIVISRMIEVFIVLVNQECVQMERNPHTALEYALEDTWRELNNTNKSKVVDNVAIPVSNFEFAHTWIQVCVKKLLSVKELDMHKQEFTQACQDVLTECYDDINRAKRLPKYPGDISKLAENLLPFLCQANPFVPFGT